jgi:hypothetical protein
MDGDVLSHLSLHDTGDHVARFTVQAPLQAQLFIVLNTESGSIASDSMTIALGTRFFVWIKYCAILPAVAFSVLSLSRLWSST